jgi:hypothetical protein
MMLSVRDLPSTMVEFEATLGAPLVDVLGSTASAKTRLLALDGAESALEGRAPLLTDVAVEALQVGLGVAAVTRTDCARAVADLIRAATAATGLDTPLAHYEVSRLTSTEVSRVTETFPSLARPALDPRG